MSPDPSPTKVTPLYDGISFSSSLWAFNHFTNCLLSHIQQHLGMLTALELRAIAPQMKIVKTSFLLRTPTL